MLRLGCGAGFSSDRLSPAIDLARDGNLDWLIFETIGERTLAFGHRDRQLDPRKGYNPQLAKRLEAVLPHCRRNSTRIMTNMGVANVPAAAEVVVDVARRLDLKGLKVAALLGDEVTHLITPETVLFDYGDRPVSAVGKPLVGANVYLGMDAILPAVQSGADVIITGRVADPSLFLAPIAAHFDWRMDDWQRLGSGTLVGHLMECGMQVTGGYFADPGLKDVPRLADCGFPIAEVEADGRATITKLDGSGGAVTPRTVKEQLMYEVHDPAAYLTPDVTADFSRVEVAKTGNDRVSVANASGHARPDKLKVTVGFDGGFLGEAGVSYAGPGAARRAELAAAILHELLARVPGAADNYRIDLIGLDAVHATAETAPDAVRETARDVRVRCAMRTMDREPVETMLWEVEALLCCGPAGGGGYRGRITPSVVTQSALIDRSAVSTTVQMYEA
ncbi:MAG: DUF1446 domain-containing protein [Hyphomicrobiaceae bacterium]|nr:DUF1446 domain-containing protein [Hyphomicrobiaceae bacterium]